MRKDEEIRNLEDYNAQLKGDLLQAQVDSDKVTVSALTKAVQEKDKLIEYLKKQEEEFSREMDKSTSVINNLKQALNESKIIKLVNLIKPFNF